MRFEHPHFLWFLLAAVPALVAFFWWAAREKRRVLEKFISARLLPGLLAGVSAGRRKAGVILMITSVVLLIVTLARPQIGFSWEEARSRGLDIVVAIDTSRSMLAADVAPNRLRRAQLSALDLKKLARTDRLGLVAFAGGAFLQCPLTLDDTVFRQSVEALDVSIIPQGGTALAEAIDAAKGAFKEGNDNHKVLVLFTDGEDHDGNAIEAAKSAAKDGMRIFTVGVGTANGELLRTVDVSGRSEFIKDSEGNAVKSRLNEALLREVAQETGGFYLPLSGANTMNLLYERGLAPLPKSDLASQRIKRHHERYQWLLGIAIVLLLIEMLLPDRKTSKATMAGAGNAAATTAARAAAILAIVALPSLVSAGPGGALKRYQGGEYARALEEYERSLKSNPDDPRLHFNAGAAAFQKKDYDQALNHLNAALITEDVKLQQQAYYNIGNARFRQGESASEPQKKQQLWEQAIKNFDSALTLDPKDGDSEFNKEFVKKKLQELKQQQQQQNKDNQNDKDDKKDQKDQSKQDQQSKDQQSKDQQKQDQKDQQKNQQQQNQDKDKQGQDQQKKDEPQDKQDDASKQKQEQGGEKKPDQAQQPGEQQEGNEGQPQQGRAARMTPQQAAQLLEAVKGEEKLLTFRPVLKSNRTDRVFKDW
jgi:Ca-activated chloride channel family protein